MGGLEFHAEGGLGLRDMGGVGFRVEGRDRLQHRCWAAGAFGAFRV